MEAGPGLAPGCTLSSWTAVASQNAVENFAPFAAVMLVTQAITAAMPAFVDFAPRPCSRQRSEQKSWENGGFPP